jgi:hypothetical protein
VVGYFFEKDVKTLKQMSIFFRKGLPILREEFGGAPGQLCGDFA